jgi:hypothetical protein
MTWKRKKKNRNEIALFLVQCTIFCATDSLLNLDIPRNKAEKALFVFGMRIVITKKSFQLIKNLTGFFMQVRI